MISMDFNEKLQHLRNQKGLTQEQLAEKVCVSRVAVSKWESGRGYPNLDSLKKLSEIFGVSVDELLSSNELIDLANSQNKNNSRILRSLILGITDFLAILLFIIPLFADRFEGNIEIVNLLKLSHTPAFIKNIFIVLAGCSILFGTLELSLQNIQTRGKQKAELILSGMFSSLEIVFSAMTNQPDPCIMFFALFIIKVLAALKTQKLKFPAKSHFNFVCPFHATVLWSKDMSNVDCPRYS